MADCSEEAARRHIERIARARQEGSDELKDSLAGAIERVTMMFPQTGHFLMEFLQNAHDAGSKSVLVELTLGAVHIANDGAPFTEADVESIGRVGRSAKRASDYIGYLGIGFKSVFLFCDPLTRHSLSFRSGKGIGAPWPIASRGKWSRIACPAECSCSCGTWRSSSCSTA